MLQRCKFYFGLFLALLVLVFVAAPAQVRKAATAPAQVQKAATAQVRGKTPQGRTTRPLLGAGNTGNVGNAGTVSGGRAVPLCTATGYQECDLYEDWYEIDHDGVHHHIGYHVENCHSVITSTTCGDDRPSRGGAGDRGDGRQNTQCRDLGCCLTKSESAANSRTQAIVQSQRSCMAALGTFATQTCTGLVTPIAWTDINANTFMIYSGRYCTAPPRRNAHESDDWYQQRRANWYHGCQRDIATALTADNRSRCKDDLQRGHGDFWDKFIIYAGTLGPIGWDIGSNQNQGYEAACNQQATQLLLQSNKKKTEDDISCHQRYGR